MDKKEQIKEKVLKEAFMIFPMEDADNLEHIRKSVNKILETKPFPSSLDFEKIIDLTLQEVGKVIDKRIIHYELKLDTKGQVALERLKQVLELKK